MTEAEQLEFYRTRLGRALQLLRDWRDKYGGREHYAFGASSPHGPVHSASPTDLLRDTQKFLEGK